MNNGKIIIKRIMAYIIDFSIIYILSYSICTSNLNKQYDKYVEETDKYSSEYTIFNESIYDLNSCMEDNVFTIDEYNSFIEDNPKYQMIMDNYYEEKDISSNQFSGIINDLTSHYLIEFKASNYNLGYYSIFTNIFTVVIYLLYFVGFALITDGQTLGKRLMRIKIVTKDINKASMLNYLIRSIILYGIVFIVLSVIFNLTLNKDQFLVASSTINILKSLVTCACIVMLVVRKDNRGLHDILAHTKVIDLNDKVIPELVDSVEKKEEPKFIEVTPKKEILVKKKKIKKTGSK